MRTFKVFQICSAVLTIVTLLYIASPRTYFFYLFSSVLSPSVQFSGQSALYGTLSIGSNVCSYILELCINQD